MKTSSIEPSALKEAQKYDYIDNRKYFSSLCWRFFYF